MTAKAKFVPVRRTTFFVAVDKHGEPVSYFGFCYWKKHMMAKLKRAGRTDLIAAPVVMIEAQTFKTMGLK